MENWSTLKRNEILIHVTTWTNFKNIILSEIVCACVCVCVCTRMLSCFQLFATPWTMASQAPPSMEFSRQDYWSGLPFPPPEDLPNPGI